MGGDGGLDLSVEETWAGVEIHGPGADDNDSGRCKEDLETLMPPDVTASIFQVGVLVSLPVVDHRLWLVVSEGHNVAVEGDWAEMAVDGMDFVQDPVVVQMLEHNSLWRR